jgi:hypothetical protein
MSRDLTPLPTVQCTREMPQVDDSNEHKERQLQGRLSTRVPGRRICVEFYVIRVLEIDTTDGQCWMIQFEDDDGKVSNLKSKLSFSPVQDFIVQ